MPFFLYLSGLVAALSGAAFAPLNAWPTAAAARAKRLLLPFFGLGGLIVAGKCAAARIMFVDNPPGGLERGFFDLFWRTASSPALSIWYLFVLFVVSLATPVLLRGEARRLNLLLSLGLLLYLLPLPAYLYLDHVGRYAVFFGVGVCAGAQGGAWTSWIDRFWPYCLVLLLASLGGIALFGADWPETFTLFCVGVISMPALHGLVRFCPASCRKTLLWLGRYCFMIYLFNTVFIGLTKGILLHVWAWRAPDFGPLAACLMAAGILGPVALKQFGFRRVPWLDRLTD